jgi:hypothetical protein
MSYRRSCTRKPIYGTCKGYGPENVVVVCPPPPPPIPVLDQFQALIAAVSTLETLFDKYFVPSTVVAPLTAVFTVGAYISPAVGVRLIWKDLYVGQKYDPTNEIHRLQIKLIYQNNHWNWKKDPLFKVAS